MLLCGGELLSPVGGEIWNRDSEVGTYAGFNQVSRAMPGPR